MKFKHKEDMELFFKLHPYLILILSDMNLYCMNNDMEFIITDTISTLKEDLALNRKSTTHRTKRAADIRTRNWSQLEIKDFQSYFNHKYKDYAAYSKSGKPSLVVIHDNGNGTHGHIQIHSRFANFDKP